MFKLDSSRRIIWHMWTTFKYKYNIQQNFDMYKNEVYRVGSSETSLQIHYKTLCVDCVHVCTNLWLYACVICIHVCEGCMCMCIHGLDACVSIYIYIYVHMLLYVVCMCVHMYICVHWKLNIQQANYVTIKNKIWYKYILYYI